MWKSEGFKMIWLLPFLIPWNSDPYLISMGGLSSPVAAYPIELHERPGERMMMMTVGDFIRAKQRIESSPEFCSSAINSAVSECERVSNQIQKQAQQYILPQRLLLVEWSLHREVELEKLSQRKQAKTRQSE